MPKENNTQHPQHQRCYNRPERRRNNVIRGARWILRQVIYLRFVQQEKERVKPAIKDVIIYPIETRLAHPALMQDAKTLACMRFEFVHLAILNRVGGTCLCA